MKIQKQKKHSIENAKISVKQGTNKPPSAKMQTARPDPGNTGVRPRDRSLEGDQNDRLERGTMESMDGEKVIKGAGRPKRGRQLTRQRIL